MKHVAIYVRVSSRQQDTASQIPDLERWAASAGSPVVWYRDKATGKTMDRPGWNKLAVDLAADPEHKVAEAYGVWVEKSMYGRKYMGVERATFLIDAKGRIARAWRKVKVPGHAEEVLEAVQAMSAT